MVDPAGNVDVLAVAIGIVEIGCTESVCKRVEVVGHPLLLLKRCLLFRRGRAAVGTLGIYPLNGLTAGDETRCIRAVSVDLPDVAAADFGLLLSVGVISATSRRFDTFLDFLHQDIDARIVGRRNDSVSAPIQEHLHVTPVRRPHAHLIAKIVCQLIANHGAIKRVWGSRGTNWSPRPNPEAIRPRNRPDQCRWGPRF